MSGKFKPSKYQARLFKWIAEGSGDGIVNAVAGSGKTTSLVEAAQIIKGQALFLAFNKHIADELNARLTGTTMVARTIHSIGNEAVRRELGNRLRIDGDKYQNLCREEVNSARAFRRLPDKEKWEIQGQLKKLVEMVRVTCTLPDDIDGMAGVAMHYGIDVDYDETFDLVKPVLKAGVGEADRRQIIDFTDMLYLPWYWQLPLPQFQWVLCDECQDLSALQLYLVMQCRADGGRMLFVGDPRQSIYGFTGADANSFWNIKSTTGAKELPLSICYRCPASHIELAKAIVPQIEARPKAPKGVIQNIKEEDVTACVQEGDLILCRKTAPVVSLCIKLIAHKKPARVRGREVGREIANLARKIMNEAGGGGREAPTFDQFADCAEEYRVSQTERLSRKANNESRIQTLNDKIDALIVCATEFKVNSLDELCSEIEGLFSDDRASIWLSTVHRAKGLENERVMILEPENMPLKWKGQQPWEAEQEVNIKYVALTRAKDSLFFITGKKKEPLDQPLGIAYSPEQFAALPAQQLTQPEDTIEE